MSVIDPYFDKHGLIVTKNGNGGDSASRMGLWLVASYFLYIDNDIPVSEYKRIKKRFVRAVNKIEILQGLHLRHPDSAPDCGKPGARDFACWNKWNVLSRDQFIPLIMALVIVDQDRAFYALDILKKRHGFHVNGDWTGPQHWSMFNRIGYKGMFHKWPYFCDFVLLIGVIIQSFKKDASDSVNGFIFLLWADSFKPTWISKLALWTAKKFNNYENYFNEYFGNPNDPGAPFHMYCKPLIERYFK